MDIGFLLIAIIVAILVNYLRFHFTLNINKWVLVVSCGVLVGIHWYIFNSLSISGIILFILLSTFSFQVYGGLLASGIGFFSLAITSGEKNYYLLLSFILLGLTVGILVKQINHRSSKEEIWKKLLVKNSKELNVYREVSTTMQQTYELDRILKIIVTSVTAGHGLGFNRAMILLVNDDITRLHGKIGVGPMTADEGYETWELITKNKYRLVDLIEMQEEDEETIDPTLNKRIKEIDIKLDKGNVLFETLENETPYIIREIDENDDDQVLFSRLFNMKEFAVFPLITQGSKVGVLIIDNPVNQRPITEEGVDSVIPMANYAAIAIQQSSLYRQVEDMALKDGLTGLLNQRAFQTIMAKYLPTAEPLSLIMADIDHFKNFNDTNGHLIGNEVLIEVAQTIQLSVRKDDYAFRFGGEEFVILLPNTDEQEAAAIAERIRINISDKNFQGGSTQPTGKVTVSLGVASTTHLNDVTTNKLIEVADQALYKAKSSGRNNVKVSKELSI